MSGSIVALLVLKVSVLLGAALLVAHALRRAPAARRHGIWSAAFVALVALPPLALTLPALRVPVPVWPVARPVASPTESFAKNTEGISSGVNGAAPRRSTNAPLSIRNASTSSPRTQLPSLRATLLVAWLAGVAVALVALLVSLVRVARLAASCEELDDADWRDAVARVAGRLEFHRRVRVLTSSQVTTPMAGGLIRPTVFVPANAMDWSAERRDVVLAHEIAHLASGDPLRHLVSRVAFTLYWFHPLVWMAVRQSTSDCEKACDEAVLDLGIRPSTYARVLLEFAETAPLRMAGAALPMVKRARLESRLMAILDNSPRPSTRRRAVLPLAGAAALTLSIAAAQPSASVGPAALDTPAPKLATPPMIAKTSVPGIVTAPSVVFTTTTSTSPIVVPQSQPAYASATECWSGSPDSRSFSGTISTSGSGTTEIIQEQIGRRGNDRVIQKSFDNLRVCMRAEGYSSRDSDRPSDWPGHAPRVVLETERLNDVRRMEFAGGSVIWTINGQSRSVDGAAEAWRDALLEVLDATWEVSRLRGQVSSLRGQISSIHGQRSSLNGEVSSLNGEVSSLRGQISSLRGQESSLRGEISSIRGQMSSLQGQISSERGAISSLRASRWDSGLDRDAIDSRIRRHEEEIRRVEDQIDRFDVGARTREVERRIAALDVESKVAAVERRIRDFDLDGQTSAVRRRISDLEVDDHVNDIEREIGSLDVDNRARDIEARRDDALRRLRAALGG